MDSSNLNFFQQVKKIETICLLPSFFCLSSHVSSIILFCLNFCYVLLCSEFTDLSEPKTLLRIEVSVMSMLLRQRNGSYESSITM